MGKKKKVSLVVNNVVEDISRNMVNILEYIQEASKNGSKMVLFSETAVSGFAIADNPEEDIKLGIKSDGSNMKCICNAAKDNHINVAIGFLERDENYLYDSAVFIDTHGEIIGKYRRISKGWRHPKMNNSIYREGSEIKPFQTDFGRAAFLICGDLFDDGIVENLKREDIDFVLFPFARSFMSKENEEEQWKEEIRIYADRVRMLSKKTLMVNYIDNLFFGGAMVVDSKGNIEAQKKIREEGILIYDMDC